MYISDDRAFNVKDAVSVCDTYRLFFNVFVLYRNFLLYLSIQTYSWTFAPLGLLRLDSRQP